MGPDSFARWRRSMMRRRESELTVAPHRVHLLSAAGQINLRDAHTATGPVWGRISLTQESTIRAYSRVDRCGNPMRCREFPLFNLAVDSKLRACGLAKLRVRDVSMHAT